MAVAFSLLYLGLCRALSLIVSGSRCEADKDVELVALRHHRGDLGTATTCPVAFLDDPACLRTDKLFGGRCDAVHPKKVSWPGGGATRCPVAPHLAPRAP
jgi:hypothetical protein